MGEAVAQELEATQVDEYTNHSGSHAQHNQHQQRTTHKGERECGGEGVEQIHD